MVQAVDVNVNQRKKTMSSSSVPCETAMSVTEACSLVAVATSRLEILRIENERLKTIIELAGLKTGDTAINRIELLNAENTRLKRVIRSREARIDELSSQLGHKRNRICDCKDYKRA